MEFKMKLEYTPRSPINNLSFIETTFKRLQTTYALNTNEIGIALVDLWNFGWDNSPLVPSLGWELSLERGISHALRKKEIIESLIVPVVNELHEYGVKIFHCNHSKFLEHFPQWIESTTEVERETLRKRNSKVEKGKVKQNVVYETFPENKWISEWKAKHTNDVFNSKWSDEQAKTYDQIRIPDPIEPKEGDLLVYSSKQFHRLLSKNKIRCLFYMGFETDECVQNSDYGIINMHQYGYMTNIVRDCTTTYESAETLEGLWRTKVAIENIEKRWGYSTTSFELLNSIRNSI
jgi:nicotinamidase-related amidase